MKTIEVKNHKILVDDSDYPFLNLITWNIYEDVNTCYASNSSFGRLHNLIVPVTKPMEVDHIDRNGLNNQKSNLRVCTHQQNNWNQGKKRPGTSKYKGVYWFHKRKKWIARMRINGKTKHLGCFVLESDAAKTYDKFAILHFGEFAYLNFKKE